MGIRSNGTSCLRGKFAVRFGALQLRRVTVRRLRHRSGRSGLLLPSRPRPLSRLSLRELSRERLPWPILSLPERSHRHRILPRPRHSRPLRHAPRSIRRRPGPIRILPFAVRPDRRAQSPRLHHIDVIGPGTEADGRLLMPITALLIRRVGPQHGRLLRLILGHAKARYRRMRVVRRQKDPTRFLGARAPRGEGEENCDENNKETPATLDKMSAHGSRSQKRKVTVIWAARPSVPPWSGRRRSDVLAVTRANGCRWP